VEASSFGSWPAEGASVTDGYLSPMAAEVRNQTNQPQRMPTRRHE
jgi:hypothetical protein